MTHFRFVAALLATAAAVSGCAASSGISPTPAPSGQGPTCQPYGGCDVLEDLTNGRSRLVTLDTQSYPDALERALYDVQQADVITAAVVGHNPPHVTISGLYHH